MATFKWDNLILFTEQLAAAARLKLPLDETMRAMSRETRERGWRKAQESIAELLRLGAPLSEAMDNYPRYFPSMLRRMMRVGEEGQVLGRMLDRASGYLQSSREIQHKLQKTMIYPLVIWTVLVIQVAFIFFYITPRLGDIADQGMVNLQGQFIWMYGPALLILGDALIFYAAWLLIGATASEVEGRSIWWRWSDWAVTMLPFLGTLHRHSKSAEVCSTLGVLIESGHDGRSAVRIAKEVTRSPAMIRAFEEVDTAMAAGEHYTGEGESTLVPHTTLWMLCRSEGEPELANTLHSLAQYHRRQLDINANLVREILDPVLILVVAFSAGIVLIGLFAGFFAVSTQSLNMML